MRYARYQYFNEFLSSQLSSINERRGCQVAPLHLVLTPTTLYSICLFTYYPSVERLALICKYVFSQLSTGLKGFNINS